jgi:hypothetical protein
MEYILNGKKPNKMHKLPEVKKSDRKPTSEIEYNINMNLFVSHNTVDKSTMNIRIINNNVQVILMQGRLHNTDLLG